MRMLSTSPPNLARCHRLLQLTLAITLLSALGCGQAKPSYQLIPISGSVQFDGSPLAHASVVFDSPDGARAFGETDAQGEFQLETPTHGPGVPKGDYIVRIVTTDQTTTGSGKSVKVPTPYEENGVKVVTVADSGEKSFTFELKSRPGKDDYVSINTVAEP